MFSYLEITFVLLSFVLLIQKHIFKFGDKNYVIGVTYRDKIDSNGDPVATWDFAMVFDDKQRLLLIKKQMEILEHLGYRTSDIWPDQFEVGFKDNTSLSTLQSGLQVVGVNTGARATISDVSFTTTIGANIIYLVRLILN